MFCTADLLVALMTPIAAAPTEVTLIHIGDLHGHLLPVARPGGKQMGGLAALSSRIREIRERKPSSLLINTGDTIQGTAEVLFSEGRAIVEILNQLGVDIFVPGNWDYVYGTSKFLELFAGESPVANWNAIAANLYYVTLYDFPETPYPTLAGTRVLPPYEVKEIGGVRVAIVGLTSERGPGSVSTRTMEGFYLTPGHEEVQAAVDLLRKDVDLFVVASERGIAGNLELAEYVRGIDVILSSDTHESTKSILRAASGTVIVEEGHCGAQVGELTFSFDDRRRIVGYRWTAHDVDSSVLRPDEAIQAMVSKAREGFIAGPAFRPHVNPLNYSLLRAPIDTVVGHTRVPIHRMNPTESEMPAAIEGTSHNFLADAFRYGCDADPTLPNLRNPRPEKKSALKKAPRGIADVGIMRGFRFGTHLEPGPVRLEDLYHFIPIGPQIACGYMSGDQIDEHLERSADGVLSPFVGWWDGGWMTTYAGVTFELDPYNQFGSRVTSLRINGEEVDHEKMYRVAGFWYIDDPGLINRSQALDITLLKDADGSAVDATEVVAAYLTSLPSHTITFVPQRVRLVAPLPKGISQNRELQPWRGVPPEGRLEVRPSIRPRTAAERMEIVLEVLRGEISERVAAERAGVSRAEIYRWKKQFLEGGRKGLK